MIKYLRRSWYWILLEIVIDSGRALSALFLSFQMGAMTNGAVDREIKTVIVSSILCLCSLVVMYLLQIVEVSVRKLVTGKAVVDIKTDFYKMIGKKDINSFKKNSESYYLNIMQLDVDIIEKDYFDSLCRILNLSIQVVVASIGLLYLSSKLFIIFTLLLVPPQIISRITKKIVQDSNKDFSSQNEKALCREKEFISGFDTIRAFSKVNVFINKMMKEDIVLEQRRRKKDVINVAVSAGTTSINMIAQIICMAVAAYFVAIGEFRFGALTSSTQLLNFIFNPLNLIINHCISISSTKRLWTKIVQVDSTVEEKGDSFEYGDIIYNSVRLGYEGKSIVEGFSQKFEKGKKYVVIGKSGIGKSTLLKALIKSAEIFDGEINIAKHNINDLNINDLYKHILYVPQKTALFDGTVSENICLFDNVRSEKVNVVANMCSVPEQLLLSDAGGDKGEFLSGGEKTRISVARAMLSDAEIIIFDEPTSGLDPKTAKSIEKTIMDITNKTVIVISHNWDEEYLGQFDDIIKVGYEQ